MIKTYHRVENVEKKLIKVTIQGEGLNLETTNLDVALSTLTKLVKGEEVVSASAFLQELPVVITKKRGRKPGFKRTWTDREINFLRTNSHKESSWLSRSFLAERHTAKSIAAQRWRVIHGLIK
jgi:hypothetical protein